MSRRKDSTFTVEQECWIVQQFHQNRSRIQIRRDFRKKFAAKMNPKKIPSEILFYNVFKRFQKYGIASAAVTPKPKKPKTDPVKQ